MAKETIVDMSGHQGNTVITTTSGTYETPTVNVIQAPLNLRPRHPEPICTSQEMLIRIHRAEINPDHPSDLINLCSELETHQVSLADLTILPGTEPYPVFDPDTLTFYQAGINETE